MPRVVVAARRWRCIVGRGGLYAYKQLDIEAYPNPVPPLVEIITQPDGWSAEEVERYVTIPLEIGLAGMPGLDHIRSQSLFGLSDVKCYFKWGTDYYDGAAGGASTGCSSSSCRTGVQAAALAVERHRRGLPLHAHAARATRSRI